MMYRKTIFLLLALAAGTVAAQESSWQPFSELSAGITKFKTVTLPTYGATFGLRSDDLTLGLRYRYSPSPLHEAVPVHDVSLLLQTSTHLTPHLELYGGVATGFAIQHSQLLYKKPLNEDNTLMFSTEIDLGIRYYLTENVALTFNVGAGARLSANDWRALANQMPYDPRTIPTFVTATCGITIGIPPKVKKINLPSQLIVDGSAPILTAYTD